MRTCEYLARIGFDATMRRLGIEYAPLDDEWGDTDLAAAKRAADLVDHARLLAAILAAEKAAPRSGDLDGAKWLGHVITWPDRVRGLKTWGGQSTLPKIINAHVGRLKSAPAGVLIWEAEGVYQTKKGEGPSGIDPLPAQDAIDVGFSPSALGMDITCHPGLELLAILGLESVPLVSFGPRECGFLHDGRVWRFVVEERSGGYFFRWSDLHEYAPETDGSSLLLVP